MEVWLTRDDEGTERCDMWAMKPEKTIRGKTCYFTNGNAIRYFSYSPKELKIDFGFTPRKGTCKKYNLTLSEIEE